MFNTLDLSSINHLAVLVATVIYFFIGALWYSPLLFAKPWMEALNINPGNIDKTGMAKIMSLTFLSNYFILFCVAVLIHLTGISGAAGGFKLGLLCGVGFVFATQYINSLYEKRPMKLLLINSGYAVVGIITGAIILAIWK